MGEAFLYQRKKSQEILIVESWYDLFVILRTEDRGRSGGKRTGGMGVRGWEEGRRGNEEMREKRSGGMVSKTT